MQSTRYYREEADRCERMAGDMSLSSDVRQLYLEIAARWRRLADDIDGDGRQPSDRQRTRPPRPDPAGRAPM